MSINNKRSYTEYTVTQPTTDFAIGFDDFDEGSKDNILVTLNGVLVESLGYAAIRKNESTVTITPAITEGTVRLTRETDIDEPFHKFTAGALFSAKSMDENFQQVRHSQQEVRDGFVFLEYNTNGIVQASKEATAQAKAATVTATASAVRAETAADTAVQAVGSLQGVVDAATTATTNANRATATATTAASQATAATTTAQDAASAATVAKQEATAAAVNANAATVDTLAATGRANEAADVVADLVVGKVRAQDVSTSDGSTQEVKNTEFRNELDSLPFEGGVLADTFVTVTANDGYAATNLQLVVSDIRKTANYIVYAEKYGSTLNEAMDAINSTFVAERVRVYVPSNFPVTGTVNLDIDCDLDLTSLQVMNDIDVIFEPKIGWNGTASKCDIYVNKNSCRVGWNMLKELGVVKIFDHTFWDIGNPVAGTSARNWSGFLLSCSKIRRIELHNPATINSYVKPNAAVGDDIGPNRNILIGDYKALGDIASDINIYNPIAINLTPEEDSDATFISTGQPSHANAVFNIDVYGGFTKNVHKRHVKIQGWGGASGVRFHGDAYADAGDSLLPHACFEVFGLITVEYNGKLNSKGFMQGLLPWGGAVLKGDFDFICDQRDMYMVKGNQVRAVNLQDVTGVGSGAGGFLYMRNLTVYGAADACQVSSLSHAKIDTLTHINSYDKTLTAFGTVDIGKIDIEMIDAPEGAIATRWGEACVYLQTDATKKIGEINIETKTASAIFSRLIYVRDHTGLELEKIRVDGKASVCTIEVRNMQNIRIKDIKSNAGANLIATTYGGANMVLDDYFHTDMTTPAVNTVAPVMTNIVTKNPKEF